MLSRLGSKRTNPDANAWCSTRSFIARLAVLLVLVLAGAAPATAGCDDDERPGTPHSLRATPLGSTGIMLQWSSNVGHYDIYIRDKQGRPVPEAPDITGGATNRNYLTFYGLKPDKEYFFSIRSRSEGGTQGCVSKNASETVSARTDQAELDRICSDYEKTAQQNIHEMQLLGCTLPGDEYSGAWATRKGSHFTYCLQQKRRSLSGDANAQWQRNQDLVSCRARSARCWKYAGAATTAQLKNGELGCWYRGPRWSLFISKHFQWCMSPNTSAIRLFVETSTRNRLLRKCEARKAEQAKGGGTSGGNGGACAGVPDEWSGMLKAHNDMRGRYCAAPLTWSCDLAKGAQEYANKCILGAHGNPEGIGENLANKWAIPDKYPAGSDVEAFQDTWGCEEKLYKFEAPEIVGGFKSNCDPGPDGKGVNGHFTQVVWRSTTQLGCARAKCIVKDDKGVDRTVTNWVCRYGPGGNNSTQLAANVQKPPNCTTQKFHSLSVPAQSCFRGMVLTSSGACACPSNTRWNGRECLAGGATANPSPANPPPVETTRACPPDRPNGTFPNCCPQNARFENGVCKQFTGGSNASKTRGDDVCPSSRPNGTPPNCCPEGTRFERGACRRPTGGGGTNGTSTQRDVCKPPRPVGTYPNCCPEGMRFEGGACRRPTGGGGTNGTQPTTGICKAPRPVGTYPNCCPEGTRFEGGACRRPTGSGGTNGTQPTTSCPSSRPVGTPPNCCPTGTSFQNGTCVRPTPATPPPASTTSPTPAGGCTGGRIGRPPHCRCPSGTRLLGGRCRRVPAPTNPGPSPQKVCPPGLTGPDCNKVIVR